MTCPSEQTWVAYLAGETPEGDEQRLAEHLAGCDACRDACRELAAIDTLLASACPSEQTWVAFVAGETPHDDEQALAEHLASCASCRQACQQLAALDLMLTTQSTCPAAATWRRYVAGRTPVAAEPRLAAHLASCPACMGTCRSMTAPLRAGALRLAIAAGLAALALTAVWRARQPLAPLPIATRPLPLPVPPQREEPVKRAPRKTALPLVEMVKRGVVPHGRRPRSAWRQRLDRALDGETSDLPLGAADALSDAFRQEGASRARRAGTLLLGQFGRAGQSFLLGQLARRRGALAADLLLGDAGSTRRLEREIRRLAPAAQRQLIDALPEDPAARHRGWLARMRRGPLRGRALSTLARIQHREAVRLILAAAPRRLPPPPSAGMDRSALLRAVNSLHLPLDVVEALVRLEDEKQRLIAIPHLIGSLGSRRTRDQAHRALVAWTGEDHGAQRQSWRRWWRTKQRGERR